MDGLVVGVWVSGWVDGLTDRCIGSRWVDRRMDGVT